MNPLLDVFWRITILRTGPQALPESRFLLALVLAVHLAIGIVLLSVAEPLNRALLSALLSTAFLVAAIWVLLTMSGKRHRAMQSITALAGAEIVIATLALPLNLWLTSVEGPNQAVPGLMALLLVGWNIMVVAHVVRHALEQPFGLGVVFAIGYLLMALSLDGMVMEMIGSGV